MKLALFFTRDISLDKWVESGLFEREKLLYEKYLNEDICSKIYWITYGCEDKELGIKLKKEHRLHENIVICPMPSVFKIYKIGSYLYSLFLPFFYYKVLKKSDIYKTNQMDGSWSAVISKLLYSKPLMLRTGYTLSQLEKKVNPHRRIKHLFHALVEKFGYNYCDMGIVASQHNKTYLLDRYKINENKITVIGNFINTDQFKLLEFPRHLDRVIFVGRLNGVKNLFNLMDAVNKVELKLDIYGKGEQEAQFKAYALANNLQVNFKGLVANDELPAILNKYMYYSLVSLHEGMPKTLLEAMACGCICIGTDVEGINEVIVNGENGFLSQGIDPLSISTTLKMAIESKWQVKIQANAVKHIEEQYSLHSVYNQEKAILSLLMKKNVG